jgi:hypothetical protein
MKKIRTGKLLKALKGASPKRGPQKGQDLKTAHETRGTRKPSDNEWGEEIRQSTE